MAYALPKNQQDLYLALLQSPECDTAQWWRLAPVFPFQAMSSPLFDLLTLEDPARWLSLEQSNAASWVRDTLHTSPFRDRPEYKEAVAADCLWHAWKILSSSVPEPYLSMIPPLIQTRRHVAELKIGEKGLWKLQQEARQKAKKRPHTMPIWLSELWTATCAVEVWNVPRLVELSLHSFIQGGGEVPLSSEDIPVWQWLRLVAYVKHLPKLHPRFEAP